MPQIKTSTANKRVYTDQSDDKDKPQADERGRRAVKTSTTKAEIKKNVGRLDKVPGGDMPRVKGDDEQQAVFDAAHALVKLLSTSRDPDEIAKAITEGGNDKHAKPSAAKKAKQPEVR